MIQMYENSIMFELQTTLKNFLRIFNIHHGYLKVTLDIRLSSDIKIIVARCIDQKLSLGSKKIRPNGDFQSHSSTETHIYVEKSVDLLALQF